MKILVVSDSHGDLTQMQKAVQLEQPDAIIHLGDLLRDGEALRAQYPALPVYTVPGNCDGRTGLQETVMLRLGGKRILITHGHRHHVKFGLLRLALDAESQNADAVLYGHTHARRCAQRGAMWMLNPGSCHGVLTYGLVEITGERIACRLNEGERD